MRIEFNIANGRSEVPKKIYEPIILICKECGKEFTVTQEEQKYFKSMNYELPKRCIDCRQLRKAARKAVEIEVKAKQEAIKKAEQQRKWEADEKELVIILNSLSFPQIQIADLELKNPEKSLVIIGNGFDIMHGVKSSYWDFQKTIGKNSSLRFNMETYLDTGDLWSNLEDSLGRLNYSTFLNSDIIDMSLGDFGAYDPDAQAADFFIAVEMAIAPTFEIPEELNRRFRKWLKALTVDDKKRPFTMLHGEFKVLSFNYTEFIEELYGAKEENICYIHGCRKRRKNCKPDEIILGHKPGMEEEQWNKVELKPFKYKNQYKRYIMESALETAAREAVWYDESTTKNCENIINSHIHFFNSLSEVEEIYVIGHSLSEVDYPYFEEVFRKCDAKWFIGYHTLDDMKRLIAFTDHLGLSEVTVFRT